MKKIFIVLAVASFAFIACNNTADNKATQDTVAITTGTPSTPAIDTLAAKIDSVSVKVDSVAAKLDSAVKK